MAKEQYPLERQDLILKAMDEELKHLRSEDGQKLPEYPKHVIRAVCQLAAFGLSSQRIANSVGTPTRNVKLLLKSESVQREIARLQDHLMENSEKAFQAQLPEAMGTIYRIMKSKTAKDSNKLKAAETILDRALGKSVQRIENTTTLLKEVLTSLSQKDSSEIVDAEIIPQADKPKETKEESGPIDPLDDLLS